VKPAQIKSHLWVFVNSLIENPGFDSQTKETLTTPTKDFGSSCDLDETFLKKVIKCGVVENILLYAKARSAVELKKHR
jgi:DNA topoisomerase-2